MGRKIDKVNKYITDKLLESYSFFEREILEINNDALYLLKNTNENKQILFIGLGNIDYPEPIVVNGGYQCTIELNIVEKILSPLIGKYLNHSMQLNHTIWFNKNTCSDYQEVWDSFKQFDNYDLSENKEVLDQLCNHYNKIIGEYFIPFWEKYGDIQYINDEIINKVGQRELHNYFGVGLNQFKKLIIMKVCSNTNYLTHKDWLLGMYENQISEIQSDEETKAEFKLFKELIHILETQY